MCALSVYRERSQCQCRVGAGSVKGRAAILSPRGRLHLCCTAEPMERPHRTNSRPDRILRTGLNRPDHHGGLTDCETSEQGCAGTRAVITANLPSQNVSYADSDPVAGRYHRQMNDSCTSGDDRLVHAGRPGSGFRGGAHEVTYGATYGATPTKYLPSSKKRAVPFAKRNDDFFIESTNALFMSRFVGSRSRRVVLARLWV